MHTFAKWTRRAAKWWLWLQARSSYILSWEIEGRFGVICAGAAPSPAPLGPSPAPRKWWGQPSPELSCSPPGKEGSLLIQMLFTPPLCQQLPGSEGARLELELSPIAYVLGDLLPWLPGWACQGSLAGSLISFTNGLLGSVAAVFWARTESLLLSSPPWFTSEHSTFSPWVAPVQFAKLQFSEGSSNFPPLLPLGLKFSPDSLMLSFSWTAWNYPEIP